MGILKRLKFISKLNVFSQLSLRVKLLGTFGIVMLLFIAGFILSFVKVQDIQNEKVNMEVSSETAVVANELGGYIQGKYIIVNDYIRRQAQFGSESYDYQNDRLNASLQHVESQLSTTEQHELFQTIVMNNNAFNEMVSDIRNSSQANYNREMIELDRLSNEAVEASHHLSELLTIEMNLSAQAVDEAIRDMSIIFILSLVVALVVGSGLFVLLSERITRALNKTAEITEQISEGNLAVEKVDYKANDEIGKLTTSVNRMSDNLRDMVIKLSGAAEQVASSSEQLTASANETSKATEQITESIQEVASGAEKQVESSNTSQQVAADMSKGMSQISSHVTDVNDSSISTAQKAEDGLTVIKEAIEQMNLTDEKTRAIAGQIEQLGSKSNEIGNITSLITDVAEQTNLLALNAAIEAARAGEHGKGFAVVADEVRKLAEQTSQAAGQINNLIKAIQSDISLSIAAISEGQQTVTDSASHVKQAGTSFEEIAMAVKNVSSQIEEVSAAVQQLNAGTQAMVGAIDESTSIAEQSAGYTQSIAASAEEQNASMEEVTASAQNLAHMAEELQDIVKQFKV